MAKRFPQGGIDRVIDMATTRICGKARRHTKAIEQERIRNAAPALLEALEDMLNQGCGNYEKKSCKHDFYCVCPEDKARAAIALVKGK
jgi:hypothetical protein